jgi:hypothetical protein
VHQVLKLVAGLFMVFALTGCFGEDYDVGVPIAYLNASNASLYSDIQLTEANINWSSSGGEVKKTIDDIEAFGLSQDKIWVSPGQDASFHFEENEENGGSSSPESVTATLWDRGEQMILELNEYDEFVFPAKPGNYVLEVSIGYSTNKAQYVGHIVIRDAKNK